MSQKPLTHSEIAKRGHDADRFEGYRTFRNTTLTSELRVETLYALVSDSGKAAVAG
jgi:hypothetical protein